MRKRRSIVILLTAAIFAFSVIGCASNDKEETPTEQQGNANQSGTGSSTQTTTTQSQSSSQGSSSTRTGQGAGQNQQAKDPYAGLSAQQIMAMVEQSRKTAIDAGARNAAPQTFAAAEKEYQRLRQALASGSEQDITNALKDLDQRYKGLASLARARAKKARIDSLGYAQYDQKAYDDGSALLTEVSNPELAAKMTGATFNAKAARAEAAFDRVLKTGDAKTGNNSGAASGQNQNQNQNGGANSGKTNTKDPYAGLSDEQILALVEKSRAAAIESGAPTASPDAWKAAEAEYERCKRALSSGSGQNITQALKDLDQRYKGLDVLAKALAKKARIEELDLAKYNRKDYDEGTSIVTELLAADASVTTGATYYAKATRADADYARVLRSAFTSLATDARTEAYKAKLKADEVKAYISRKADYDHAISAYKTGELRRSTSPESAYENYKTATSEFTVLYEEIAKARAAAQSRIDAAKERVAQSEANAAEADKEAPLGAEDERLSEIVDADAKLLEDDDFSGANKATELENPLEAAEQQGPEK